MHGAAAVHVHAVAVKLLHVLATCHFIGVYMPPSVPGLLYLVGGGGGTWKKQR